MKTQLLSTLTHNKAWLLFFSNFLHLKRAEAGQALKNCLLTEYSASTSYEVLLNFIPGLVEEKWIYFCCDKTQCTGLNQSACADPNASGFWAGKNFFQNMYSVQSNNFQDKSKPYCFGILGDELITNNDTTSSCHYYSNLNLTYVANSIASVNSADMTGINSGYATYFCPTPRCSQNLAFGWDNGGWISNVWRGPCIMQWPGPWPGPANKNPFTATSTSSTSTSAQTSSLLTPTFTPPPTDDHLLEKILIPVGTITATSLISGLTYYYCKKKKNRVAITNNDLQLEERTFSNSNSDQHNLSPLPSTKRIESAASTTSRSPQTDYVGTKEERRRSPQKILQTGYFGITEEARNPHTEYFEIGESNLHGNY